MERYERALALHRLLKTARYPVSTKRMMDELGCSRATLYRDLAFLRDALGAPLDSTGDGAYRYDEAEGGRFELPGLWLSSDELHPCFFKHCSPLWKQLRIVAFPNIEVSAILDCSQGPRANVGI